MWIDQNGVFHTVALPRPEQILATDALRDLQQLKKRYVRRTLKRVAVLEDEIFDQEVEADQNEEARYEGEVPPQGLIAGPLSSPDDVVRVLEAVEWRWRLDAVMAIQDILDD